MTNDLTSKIRQLRDLGFSEGLPLDNPSASAHAGLRLESGRIGMAVVLSELVLEAPYTLVALHEDSSQVHHLPVHQWDEVLRQVHARRAICQMD
jgi:hypothetical protein